MPNITPNDLAAEMGVSPKSLRRFMRNHLSDRAGSGNRYSIPDDVAGWIRDNYGRTANRRVVTVSLPANLRDDSQDDEFVDNDVEEIDS